MERKEKYFAATTIAVLLWSASFIATKITYQAFTPLMVGFIRFLIAAVILGLVRILRHETVRPGKKEMRTIALSGLLGITLYFAAENIGVQHTSASNASLIVASFPAMTALLEFIIYRRRLEKKKLFGIILAFSGVGILTIAQGNTADSGVLLGNVMLIIAGIIWAFYNFITRAISEKYSPLTLSFYQMVFGTIFFIPLVLVERGTFGSVTDSGIFAMIYLACGCSVAAFLLYNFGLRKLSATTAISLMNLVPVFGLIFSALLLKETITLRQIAGGIVVIIGVILST